MAVGTQDDRDQGKPLSSAEGAEFDQLSARLRDTPAGDSDQPYDKTSQYLREGRVQAGGPSAIRGGTRTQTGGVAHPNPNIQRGGFGVPAGTAPPSNIQRGGFGSTKRDMSPEDIKKKEDEKAGGDDKVGKGYTADGGDDSEKGGRFRRYGRRVREGFKRNRRAFLIGGIFSGFGVVGGLIMLSVLPFQLNHILQNMDAHTFARLQGVDTRGRSSKWVKSYLTARLMDIEEPGNKKPTDNILFRSDRVDYNKPWVDWYKTMRASKFEKDMFEKQGIKFASMAVRENGQIKIRVAKITVKDTELSFDPFDGPNAIDEATLEAATKGDVKALEKIDRLTGKLDEFVQIELFDNKGGRKELKKAVNEMLKVNGWNWWNAVKRYHIRKDIQNMTGITDWKFFETTRQKWREKAIGARNKMLAKALPANAKSGKFLRCMFGIDSCRASTDPSSPDNKNLPNEGKNSGGDKTDSEGNPVGDGTPDLEPGIKPDAELSDFAKKIARELIKKGNLATSVVSIINSLSIFDENVNNHSFSKIVETARGQQTAALYSYFAIANDQLRTGEAVGDEVDDFMGMVSNTTNTEGWETVVNERPNTVLAAGEFVPASNKKEYCSEEHQAAMQKPENYVQASNEFVFNCPGDQIGAVTNAALFEDTWNNGIGAILHPILTVWRNSVGFIVDIFQDVVDFIVGPAMDFVLKTLGLDKKIEQLMGWLGEKVLAFSGAGPMWDGSTLPGKIVNLLFQGAAYVAEAATRGQGGASTTPKMKQETTARYFTGMREDRQNSTFYERYLSLDQPDSVAADALFALVNRSPGSIGQNVLGSMGNVLSMPFNLISKTVHAADGGVGSPYTAAEKLAAIDTYDFPADRCLDREIIGTKPTKIGSGVFGDVFDSGAAGDGLKEGMTPQNATNAADPDIGLFKPEELNWDLLRDKDRWYAELYNRAGDDEGKAKQVWNCALLDNAVAGGMGGLYGYQGVGALSSTQTILKD